MLQIGDIVSLSLLTDGSSQNDNNLFLITGKCATSENVTASQLSRNSTYNDSEQFTERLLFSDLTEGSLEDEHTVLIDTIMTVAPDKCTKVGRIHQDKLDAILRKTAHYAGYSHYQNRLQHTTPSTYVSVGGKVLDEKELFNMIDASLDMWLTAGRFHDAFEKKFEDFLNVKHVLAVNSGSSANLLALSALTSHKLGERRLKEGDEVITVAAAFPTTVAPIIQNNLIPVFVDVEPRSYNIDPLQIENAITEKTKAIFIAHTLGNPFNIDALLKLREKYNLYLIEDNCDALGSMYSSSVKKTSADRYTGTFGDIAAFSFYPAHHITMGEGGAVATNNSQLRKIMLSLRDWGRDCWCPTGKDNACTKRFTQQHGKLPSGYDHKYVYSHIGYNLKITDWQAAVGLEQIEKLPSFIKKRQENYELLYNGLSEFKDYLVLPEISPQSKPSWFGFPIIVKDNNRFDKIKLVTFLEAKNIGTRQLFAGNILRHPAFVDNKIKMRIKDSGILYSDNLTENDYKMLPNTNTIMTSSFWVGVGPALDSEAIDYIIDKVKEFIASHG